MARALGVTHDVPDVPSVVLGAGEVSVLDMATAYSTFRDSGRRTTPTMIVRVTDASGRTVWTPDVETERALSPQIADQVTAALVEVVTAGTGRGAAVPGQYVAGKTGTTTNNRDAWFVGYTCDITTAVWMGYPNPDADGNPRFMSNFRGISVTGGSFPAQIWTGFMRRATDGGPPCAFPSVSISQSTSSTVEPNCPVDSTDTTDPNTPAELCPPITVDTTDPDETDPETQEPTDLDSTTTTDPGDDSTTTTTTTTSTTTTTTTSSTTTTEPPSDE